MDLQLVDDPTPSKIPLKSIDDVRVEMAKVYRLMRQGRMESQEGTRLTYVLAQIGKLIESHELEIRLRALETLQGRPMLGQ